MVFLGYQIEVGDRDRFQAEPVSPAFVPLATQYFNTIEDVQGAILMCILMQHWSRFFQPSKRYNTLVDLLDAYQVKLPTEIQKADNGGIKLHGKIF